MEDILSYIGNIRIVCHVHFSNIIQIYIGIYLMVYI